MKIISTTNTRKNIAEMINEIKYTGEVFGIGRRNSIEALLIRFPCFYNKNLNEITNINAYSKGFDFLESEPEIYSLGDLKKRYA